MQDASDVHKTVEIAGKPLGAMTPSVLKTAAVKSCKAIYRTIFLNLDTSTKAYIMQRVLTSIESVSLMPIKLFSIAPGICYWVHNITATWCILQSSSNVSGKQPSEVKKVAFILLEMVVLNKVTVKDNNKDSVTHYAPDAPRKVPVWS